MSIELKGLLAALAAGLISLGAAFAVAAIGRSVSPHPHAPLRSASSAPPSAPVASPVLVASGQKFFAQSCASCHGAHGEGGDGPALQNAGLSDAAITTSIENGYAGAMPAFRSKYNPSDIAAITAYVQTLK